MVNPTIAAVDERTRLLVDNEGEVELERNFSFVSALGLAFTLLNTWTGEEVTVSADHSYV